MEEMLLDDRSTVPVRPPPRGGSRQGTLPGTEFVKAEPVRTKPTATTSQSLPANGDQRPEGVSLDEDPVGRDPVGHDPISFGTWLRQQREGREIDLRDIAETTKISVSYLQAFEEDRFDILPGLLFEKGFLRQYAQHVGLDPEEVVNFYISALRDSEEEEEVAEPEQEDRRTDTRGFVLLAVVAAAVVVVLIGLLSRWNDRDLDLDRLPAPTATRPEQPEALAVAAAVAEPPADPEPVTDPGPPPPPLSVTLDFSSECWVEASVDGERQISEIKIQGESLLLEAEETVDLKIGDVGAVLVEVNGHPFHFDQRPRTSVRTQRIDLEVAAALAGPQQAEPRQTGSRQAAKPAGES